MQVREAEHSFDHADDGLRGAVEALARRIKNPVERLRFIQTCGAAWRGRQIVVRRSPFARYERRIILLSCLLEATRSEPRLLRLQDRCLLLGFRLWRIGEPFVRALGERRRLVAAAALGVAFAAAAALTPLLKTEAEPVIPAAPTVLAAEPEPDEPPTAPDIGVWLVESDGNEELYSNGLRIDNAFLTRSEPMVSIRLAADEVDPLAGLRQPAWRRGPAGIVYHTTVSETVPPLAQKNNQLIRRRGQALLRYIAERKLYHFVIDRFGRAYRLVPEDEVAYHAGYSLWSVDGELFVNLNNSFIGIACETRPEAVEPGARPEVAVRPAQLAAVRLLTAMLRERYGISEQACVAHEMISLNPSAHLIGYHTDWAGRFPFEKLGLPNNYEAPHAAMADWGFSFDADLIARLNGRLWPGVHAAERLFQAEAAQRGRSVEEHRRRRAQAYSKLLEQLKKTSATSGAVGAKPAAENAGAS